VKFACKVQFIIFLLLAFPLSYASSFGGPLQVKNLYPIFLHAGQPYLEKAAVESSISFSLSHSSTYTVQESAEWIMHLDMEITEFNLRYKKVIADFIEFDMDIPVIITGSGFMDGFLADYHDAFGFDDYGRSRRPHNEFLYEVRRDGNLIIEGKSGTQLGDIRLSLKKTLRSSDNFHLSIKGDVEIPVSNAKQGFSNGSIDTGISVLLDRSITKKIMTYWNAGAVFPGNVKGHEELEMKNFVYGGVAIEAEAGEGLSVLVQLLGQSSIYPSTGLEAVDREAYLIAFGGRYEKGGSSFELSLTEDLNTSGAPDFIINLTYKMLI
jgi:hypothetical protein